MVRFGTFKADRDGNIILVRERLRSAPSVVAEICDCGKVAPCRWTETGFVCHSCEVDASDAAEDRGEVLHTGVYL